MTILGIGSPCVDWIYRVDDAFLREMGFNKGDCQYAVSWEEFAASLELFSRRGFVPVKAVGGSASNTIRGLAALGNSTAFYGAIGNDAAEAMYLEGLERQGVKSLLVVSETPTSQVAVLRTEDHQRTFLVFSGAGRLLVEQKCSPEIFEGISLVHVEGYFLDHPTYCDEVMSLAKSKGVKIALDIGCASIARDYGDVFLSLVEKYVDVVFINEEEVRMLLKMPAEKGCELLAKLCPVAVVQVGKRGCWVGSEGGRRLFHSPAIEVEVVDTTGAGDLFACGFLHGYVRGCALQECAWMGNLVGSVAVTVVGAEIPSEKWVEIQTLGRFNTK